MSVAYILFLRPSFLNVNLKTKSEIYREFLMTRLPFSFYFFSAYTIDEKLNKKKRFCNLHCGELISDVTDVHFRSFITGNDEDISGGVER